MDRHLCFSHRGVKDHPAQSTWEAIRNQTGIKKVSDPSPFVAHGLRTHVQCITSRNVIQMGFVLWCSRNSPGLHILETVSQSFRIPSKQFAPRDPRWARHHLPISAMNSNEAVSWCLSSLTQIPGGLAYQDNRLQKDDHILEINSQDLRNSTQEQAAQIIQVDIYSDEKQAGKHDYGHRGRRMSHLNSLNEQTWVKIGLICHREMPGSHPRTQACLYLEMHLM